MRRVRYAVAASLDGFIAGPKGEADWIVMDPEFDFDSLYAEFDTILMGRRSYEAAGGARGGSMLGMKTFVFSRTLRQSDHRKVTIVGENATSVVAELRSGEGKDIWLFGGGSLFRSLAEAGLVDTVEVGLVPVLLGEGIPLLPPGGKRVTLALAAHRVYSTTGTIGLEYRVIEEARPRRRRASPAAKR